MREKLQRSMLVIQKLIMFYMWNIIAAVIGIVGAGTLVLLLNSGIVESIRTYILFAILILICHTIAQIIYICHIIVYIIFMLRKFDSVKGAVVRNNCCNRNCRRRYPCTSARQTEKRGLRMSEQKMSFIAAVIGITTAGIIMIMLYAGIVESARTCLSFTILVLVSLSIGNLMFVAGSMMEKPWS